MPSTTKFQLSSIKYENLSNRMQRLRHSQNHSNSAIPVRSASVDRLVDNSLKGSLHGGGLEKGMGRNTTSTTALLMMNQNTSLLTTVLKDQSSLDATSKYAGRVTKNTGIRKYNQRMLKEIGNTSSNASNNTRKTPTKYTTPQKVTPIETINNRKNRICQNYQSPLKVNTHSNNGTINSNANSNFKSGIPFIKIEQQRQTITKNPLNSIKNYTRCKLSPGKIYSRQELQKYFNVC